MEVDFPKENDILFENDKLKPSGYLRLSKWHFSSALKFLISYAMIQQMKYFFQFSLNQNFYTKQCGWDCSQILCVETFIKCRVQIPFELWSNTCVYMNMVSACEEKEGEGEKKEIK